MTLRLTMPDGEARWVTLQGRYDPHDGEPRLLGTVIDITHDVEADAQLREVHEKRSPRPVERNGGDGLHAGARAQPPARAITNYLEAPLPTPRSRGDPDHDILDALDRARARGAPGPATSSARSAPLR